MNRDSDTSKPIIGWREWLALPSLGIAHIKAKVDTGARTSAIHAFYVEPFKHEGEPWVRFGVHPWQGRDDIVAHCEAPLADQRMVTDSGGHQEMRYVIQTDVSLGGNTWSIEVTLTNRDTMKFRMLLGRTALQDRYIVDASSSYLLSTPPPQQG